MAPESYSRVTVRKKLRDTCHANFAQTLNPELLTLTTRGASKIHLQRPNTKFYQSTFEFMGTQAYNNLPQEIRDISSHQIFKRALNGLTLILIFFFFSVQYLMFPVASNQALPLHAQH